MVIFPILCYDRTEKNILHSATSENVNLYVNCSGLWCTIQVTYCSVRKMALVISWSNKIISVNKF